MCQTGSCSSFNVCEGPSDLKKWRIVRPAENKDRIRGDFVNKWRRKFCRDELWFIASGRIRTDRSETGGSARASRSDGTILIGVRAESRSER